MSPAKLKPPATLADRCRKISEGSRFYVDKARDVVEELADVKTAVDELARADVAGAVITLRDALDSLETLANAGIGLSEPEHAKLTEAIGVLEELMPDEEALAALTEALEMAEESVNEVEYQRDDPSSYDADERSQSRDTARENFDALADALGGLDPSEPTPAESGVTS
jgi:hypothetical protein